MNPFKWLNCKLRHGEECVAEPVRHLPVVTDREVCFAELVHDHGEAMPNKAVPEPYRRLFAVYCNRDDIKFDEAVERVGIKFADAHPYDPEYMAVKRWGWPEHAHQNRTWYVCWEYGRKGAK